MTTVPQTIGKYTIEGELGRGGMGVVYRAIDPVIQRPVALKTIIKSQLDPADAESQLQRFKREAQAAGRLLHPNIVSVYEYGEDADRAFIAMEFVDGRGLNEYMSPGIPLNLELTRRLVAQILDALHFAHSLGVVHRDIKPSNLMITWDWKVKVSDFGIAQLDATKLTQMGTVLGTPGYMSPEQFKGEATDHRADIFSASVAFYELLTGQKPFVGNSLGSLVHAVLNTAPVAPSQINTALHVAIDTVLLKALAVQPQDRFASVKQFQLALNAAFDGEVSDGTIDLDTTIPTEILVSPAYQATHTPLPTRKIDFTAVGRKLEVAGIRNAQPGNAQSGSTQPGTLSEALDTTINIAAPRARILFVDDEERILSAMRLLFKLQYEVHVTTDAAEALEMLKKMHFHVLVSDQRMPNMNGTELLSRAKVASPNTVRILLTGYSDLAAIIGSINEGEVYRFANKPWNTTEIRTLLADAAAIGMALEDAPIPVISGNIPEEGVLIVDSEREIYLASRDLFGSHYRILYAPDLISALDVLRDEKVAVLVADIEGNQEHNRTLFKLLKREHPQILTIAMTAASDSDLVIEMINQAQLFRFLNTPVKLPTLQQHITAAMAQFQKYQAQPKLLLKQKVDKPAEPVAKPNEESSVGSLILGSLRALRLRLTGK